MKRWSLLLPGLLLILVAFFSLYLGQYQVSVKDVFLFIGWKLFGFSGLLGPEQKVLYDNILMQIRLPRIVAAVLIGASLSVSGAAFQALFINPLVSPGLLGVLAGASFGAAFGMLVMKSWFMVQCSTLLFGFVAVGIAVGIAKVYRIQTIIMLVLGGIISGAFFTALLSLIKFSADPYNQLPAIVYWLMGTLSAVDSHTITVISGPILVGLGTIILHGRQLNILSMGEEEAQSLGVNVHRARFVVIFFATLISALTVVVGGIIGWVGLIIPHICRMIFGPNNEVLLPASAIVGAIYLVVIDDISRLSFSYEVPIGIITSIIGIPFFALVLKNAGKGWR